MNDHNLDDLIIDTIAPKNNKTKSLLTIVALLIVVLIVAIILTKTLLKSPDDTVLTFEENISELIAPELKLQEPTEIAKPKEEPSLSTIIDEKISAPKEVKKPKIIEEVAAPKVIKEETEAEILHETVTVTEEVAAKSVEPTIMKPVVTKPVVSKPATTIPVEQAPVKPKVTAKPKTEVKKPVIKTEKKPTVSKPVPQTSIAGKYYVQVGSFKESPSKRLLSVIKSSGFKYHVTQPDKTGYKKLLIGPYKTRAEVDKARGMVRDRINKNAFVVQK